MTNGSEVVDGGQVWLITCLNATLDANLQTRTAAENALKQASLHAGPSLHFKLSTLLTIFLTNSEDSQNLSKVGSRFALTLSNVLLIA